MKFLPFLSIFHQRILNNEKHYTLRTKKYGEPGEIVNSPVGLLRLIEVRKERLVWVRDNLWADEGCDSPEHFERIWIQIHPGGFNPEQKYWLHRFELVKQ